MKHITSVIIVMGSELSVSYIQCLKCSCGHRSIYKCDACKGVTYDLEYPCNYDKCQDDQCMAHHRRSDCGECNCEYP